MIQRICQNKPKKISFNEWTQLQVVDLALGQGNNWDPSQPLDSNAADNTKIVPYPPHLKSNQRWRILSSSKLTKRCYAYTLL